MRILHVLSQRPMLTGSGITLDALVRHAAEAGHDQHVVCGVPADDPRPMVGGLPQERIHALTFDAPLPGMSDVMPYPSTRFSSMSLADVEAYEARWLSFLRAVPFEPELIHAHHVWLLGARLKDVWPDVPIVTHCHATGLRQMELCPALVDRVREGIRRNERFVVLTELHREQLATALGIDASRIEVVGAGFRDELFRYVRRPAGRRLVYAGKYSAAKGLPWLLDAVEGQALELHIAGAGDSEIEARMQAMPNVIVHGRLEPAALARLFAHCDVAVVPSFYEGLPLVLVEALATGCRLVSTALPTVVASMAPHLGDALRLVPLPRLIGPDVPEPNELPRFVDDLRRSILEALDAGPLRERPEVEPFTWRAVYARVAEVWRGLEGGA